MLISLCFSLRYSLSGGGTSAHWDAFGIWVWFSFLHLPSLKVNESLCWLCKEVSWRPLLQPPAPARPPAPAQRSSPHHATARWSLSDGWGGSTPSSNYFIFLLFLILIIVHMFKERIFNNPLKCIFGLWQGSWRHATSGTLLYVDSSSPGDGESLWWISVQICI